MRDDEQGLSVRLAKPLTRDAERPDNVNPRPAKGPDMPIDTAPPDDAYPEIPEDDPDLQAEVKRALGPYEKLVPPEILQTMRETLIDALTTHPVGVRLMEKARKAKQAQSGTQANGAGEEPAGKKGSLS